METAGSTDAGRSIATQPAGAPVYRSALIAGLISAGAFAAAVPFAKVQLPAVFAFIPIYESALVVNDLITAVLLFGQSGVLRSRALLILPSGYLFTALAAAVHALTFPGLFAPTGLLGAGAQGTAWLYMFWHGGFPLFVMAYALLKRPSSGSSHPHSMLTRTVLMSMGAVAAAVAAMSWLATSGQGLLPALMQGNGFAPAQPIVMTCVWLLSPAALAVLVWRRPHTFLDAWLMVVMCAWFFDIALSGVFNHARFDLGFYAGRIYGLIASSIVLGVLLLENVLLYFRLARAHEGEVRERRRAEQATLEAKQANLAKSAFLANMSHELRTPLNAVLGFSELILDELKERTPRDISEDVKKIHSAGTHLLGLINDVLDLSKIEAGRMDVYIETFPVEHVLDEAAATANPLMERNGNRLELDYGADLASLISDRTKVRQILLNLLSNAAKFTQGGTVTLKAFRAGNAGGSTLVLTVGDTGIGIKPERLGLLFQPFAQAEASTASEYGGSGLGLAITKVYCEMLGGRISVQSQFGRGTTFRVELPYRRNPAAGTGPPSPHTEAAAGAGAEAEAAPGRGAEGGTALPPAPLALVIDDDTNARMLIRHQLERAGYAVEEAAGGEEGVRLARALLPRLITLDVLMPKMDGWQVIAAIRSDKRLAHIPIIVASIVDERGRGFRLGASEYLVKPIDGDQFAGVVARYRASAPGRQALLIEDDRKARMLMKDVLTRDGWAVTEAASYPSALHFLRKDRADIIVTGLVPEDGTLDFIDTVRKEPAWAGVPILVVASGALTDQQRAALNRRVADALAAQDWTVEELLGQVREIARTAAR